MTVRKTLQDSAYVAVGVAVLGMQRIQAHRREVATQLQEFGNDTKARIEPVVMRVSEPAKAGISRIPAAAAEVGSQLAELPNKVNVATDRFGDTQDKLMAAIQRAMAEGRARLGNAPASKAATPYTPTHNATSDTPVTNN